MFERCIWCEQSYPPAVKSREHILPEYLGVDVTLPAGAVCKECNDHLNRVLDQPLKLFFQKLITSFGVSSSKRKTPASTPVRIPTERGPIAAIMDPGGKIRFPPRTLRERIQEGPQVLEEWVVQPDQVDELLAEFQKTHELLEAERSVVEHGIPEGTIGGKAATLIRSTLRAGINLLAMRKPDLLHLGEIREAKRYVFDGTGALPERRAEVSPSLMGGRIKTAACRAEHALIVTAAPRGAFLVEMRLFGDLFCRVWVTDKWQGPHVSVEEPFSVENTAEP